MSRVRASVADRGHAQSRCSAGSIWASALVGGAGRPPGEKPGPKRDSRRPFTFDSPVQNSGLVPLRGLHVMLVEDNPDARTIVRRVLEHCGAMVTVAETARAALRRLRAM